MNPLVLVLAGLIIGAVLYALMIRRRAGVRLVTRVMATELSASNDIAVARVNEAARRQAEAKRVTQLGGFATAIHSGDEAEDSGSAGPPEGVEERRSGRDRRGRGERSRGRGRRNGGERRRGNVPWR